MVIAIRTVLSLLGVLFLWIGMQFLIDPVVAGIGFGVEAMSEQGLSLIRGDFTSFFWVSGGCLLIGAWRNNPTLLHVAAALMGIVLAGRALSLWVDGTYPLWYAPMAIEAATVIFALFGARVLGKQA